MPQRIRRFTVAQTATMGGALYFFLGLIALPFIWIFTRVAGSAAGAAGVPGVPFGGAMLILIPILYGIVGFICVAIMCLVYNLVAGWVGGIEVELEPGSSAAAP